MGPFEIFIIRALLAGLFSVLISRFYLQGKPFFWLWTILLAVIMLAIVYAKEYFRKKYK